MISEYTSNQDLYEACLASSAIPYLTFQGFVKKYRGMNVLDGGLTNNTPIFTELPRRTLVFRLTDLYYPVKLLTTPQGIDFFSWLWDALFTSFVFSFTSLLLLLVVSHFCSSFHSLVL
jgi:hypothetical protein